MYNEKLKEAYLLWLSERLSSKSLSVYRKTLKRISSYEVKYSKNVFEFSAEEYLDLINGIGGQSSRGRASRNVELRRYIRWCHEDMGENVNPELLSMRINDISFQGHDLTNMVASPADLQSVLAEYREANSMDVSYDGVWIVYETYFWLAFAGLDMASVDKIKNGDVDLKNRVINYGGDLYPLYSESIAVIKRCIETRSFIRISANRLQLLERSNSDQLLRSIKDSNFISLRSSASRYVRNSGASVRKLSFYSVRNSGIFYEAWLEENVTQMEPDFRAVAEREYYRNIKENPEGEKKGNPSMTIYIKKTALANDYKNWKRHFDK